MRKSKRFLRQSADGGITAEVNAHRCGIFPEKESRFGRHFFFGEIRFLDSKLDSKTKEGRKIWLDGCNASSNLHGRLPAGSLKRLRKSKGFLDSKVRFFVKKC